MTTSSSSVPAPQAFSASRQPTTMPVLQPDYPVHLAEKYHTGPIPLSSPSLASLQSPDGDSLHTDIYGWRLLIGQDSHGQHKWIYLQSKEEREQWPLRAEERWWLGLGVDVPEGSQDASTSPAGLGVSPGSDTDGNAGLSYLDSARAGYRFYRSLQSWDGHWAGEYGGPLFLIPGVVIGLYVTGLSLRPEQVIEMRRYILSRRRGFPENDKQYSQAAGEGHSDRTGTKGTQTRFKGAGWGLHTAAPPTAYGTVMNYISLRILGMDRDDPIMVEVRSLIHQMGGATCVPSWAKAWLSILGCYEWSGVNPVPPELWLLPSWVPFHPSKWWIHTRNVYIPLSYLYGKRFVGPITPLVRQLREELYLDRYEHIDWPRQRNNVCELDNYVPHHPVMNVLNAGLGVYEQHALSPLRKAGLDAAYKLVVMEDENTGYQTLAPVSKMFNLMCRYAAEGPDSEAFAKHKTRIDDVLWMGADGLMCCGTNGSQLWDTSFITQALVETGLAEEEENRESCLMALDWLDKCQILENPKYYKEAHRHTTKGAWPFSTPEQGYTVSDCTAEGLKAVIALQGLSYAPQVVSEQRMKDAVDVLLTMQNANGGFASYELVRGVKQMEWLNVAEVFGDIMIEYTYPECTTSALSALLHFSKVIKGYRSREIERTVDAAIAYLHNEQLPDGSWFGSWGICFTYATMFALESLSMAGETHSNSSRVRKACQFLISKQMDDGGWGETYMSCVTHTYHQHEQSQVVQTAWSILSLIYAKYPDKEAIRRAADLIMSRQQPNGSWLQEDVEGIFNKNCGIYYPNFKFSFTIWALGKAHHYVRS